jgi:hypothetical protein
MIKLFTFFLALLLQTNVVAGLKQAGQSEVTSHIKTQILVRVVNGPKVVGTTVGF